MHTRTVCLYIHRAHHNNFWLIDFDSKSIPCAIYCYLIQLGQFIKQNIMEQMENAIRGIAAPFKSYTEV